MTVPVIDARLLPMTGASGYFPSFGQIEAATGTPDAFGEDVPLWEVVPGLEAIPLAISPTPPGDVMRTPEMSRPTDTRYALLEGYYPQITTAQRLTVEDQVWTILMVDFDSQHSITRLKLQQVRA